MDFAFHKEKIKESEKIDKYLDLIRDLKKLWNMKVMVIQRLDGAIGTLSKGLEKRMGGLEIESTELLKSVWIIRRVCEFLGDYLSLKLLEKQILVSAGEINS